MTLVKLGTGLLIILMILLVGAIPALAAERYYLPDSDISVSLPDDGFIITRDITPDDPLLEQLERTWEEEMDYLEATNIYLEYVHDEFPYYDIDISMADSEFGEQIVNFNLLTDDYLSQMGQFYVDTEDANYSSYRLYSVDDIEYIVLRGRVTMEKKKANFEDYYTIYNGQEISITLYSYDDLVTNEMVIQLQQIVDSVSIGQGELNTDEFSIQTYNEISDDQSITANATEDEEDLSTALLGSDEDTSKIHQTLLWIAIGVFTVLIATIIIAIVRSKKRPKADPKLDLADTLHGIIDEDSQKNNNQKNNR